MSVKMSHPLEGLLQKHGTIAQVNDYIFALHNRNFIAVNPSNLIEDQYVQAKSYDEQIIHFFFNPAKYRLRSLGNVLISNGTISNLKPTLSSSLRIANQSFDTQPLATTHKLRELYETNPQKIFADNQCAIDIVNPTYNFQTPIRKLTQKTTVFVNLEAFAAIIDEQKYYFEPTQIILTYKQDKFTGKMTRIKGPALPSNFDHFFRFEDHNICVKPEHPLNLLKQIELVSPYHTARALEYAELILKKGYTQTAQPVKPATFFADKTIVPNFFAKEYFNR